MCFAFRVRDRILLQAVKPIEEIVMWIISGNWRSEWFLWFLSLSPALGPRSRIPSCDTVSAFQSHWHVWPLLDRSGLETDMFFITVKGFCQEWEYAELLCWGIQLLRQASSRPEELGEAELIAVGKGKLVVSYHMLCQQERGNAIQAE